jgi:quinol monooxygenase YgiN
VHWAVVLAAPSVGAKVVKLAHLSVDWLVVTKAGRLVVQWARIQVAWSVALMVEKWADMSVLTKGCQLVAQWGSR